MKKLLNILVFAKDSESALEEARKVVSEKRGTSRIDGSFGHYIDYSNGRQIPVFQVSTARFPTNEKRGLRVLNSAMEKNRRVFKESMALIRHHIANYTDDQLFNEIEGRGEIEIDGQRIFDNPGSFRDYCGLVYDKIQGQSVYLYDIKGRGITSPLILQKFLNGCNPDPWDFNKSEGQGLYWDQPLWMVSFDTLW